MLEKYIQLFDEHLNLVATLLRVRFVPVVTLTSFSAKRHATVFDETFLGHHAFRGDSLNLAMQVVDLSCSHRSRMTLFLFDL